MHDDLHPHCAYCEHFKLCFNTDTENWGYCRMKVGNTMPSWEEIEIIRRGLEDGISDGFLARARELGLFAAAEAECDDFSSLYPL